MFLDLEKAQFFSVAVLVVLGLSIAGELWRGPATN